MASKVSPDPVNPPPETQEEETAPRFSLEEEAELVEQVATHKATANKLFATCKYDEAVTKYEEAVATCPTYLHYDLAVLRSNLAACHLKLERWKEAIKEATASIEGLDKCEREEAEEGADKTETSTEGGDAQEPNKPEAEDSEVEEEIVSEGAAKAGPAVVAEKAEKADPEDAKRKKKEDIKRIRAKALMRRARARSELGGWSNLSGAEEDYKTLSTMDNLSSADKKIVMTQLKALPARTKAAQEKETAEMWAKLKELGNGVLRPFGLSTDNFQMQKDEATGGYTMNFKQSGS